MSYYTCVELEGDQTDLVTTLAPMFSAETGSDCVVIVLCCISHCVILYGILCHVMSHCHVVCHNDLRHGVTYNLSQCYMLTV